MPRAVGTPGTAPNTAETLRISQIPESAEPDPLPGDPQGFSLGVRGSGLSPIQAQTPKTIPDNPPNSGEPSRKKNERSNILPRHKTLEKSSESSPPQIETFSSNTAHPTLEASTMNDRLKQLSFLLGEWRGRAVDQFGEKGVIEAVYIFTQDPSEDFIAERDESWKDGKLLNRSISYLMFDQNIGKFVRKSVFSYGWINNEVGEWKDDRLLFDIASIDGEPSFFRGVKWRTFIRKYSDSEIGAGLELSKNGEPFRHYGETRVNKVK